MSRPPIPRPLERQVLVEAGHRCAIPTCKQPTTVIAHIVPWVQVKEHTFDNLIALCPNCHTRYDKGEIDRKAMREYKQQLAQVSSNLTTLEEHNNAPREEWSLRPYFLHRDWVRSLLDESARRRLDDALAMAQKSALPLNTVETRC